MKNHIRILLKFIIPIILIVSLSGCWNARELDTLGIVMGMGVDKSEEPGKIKLTAQIVKPGEIKSPKKEGGGGSEAFWDIDSTGDTVFSALRGFTNKSSRKLFFPHNQVLIFGRDIAEEGIQKYIDFFLRDPETRVDVWVLVSQDTAGEILDVKSELEKVPAMNIAKLVQAEAGAASEIPGVRLKDFAERLLSKTTAPVASFIEISKSKDGGKKAVILSGTAVFKRDKMVGRLDKAEGRGLLWVLGEVKSGIIKVEGPTKDKVSLEIIRTKGKIEPEIRNNRLYIKVNIIEEGNVGDQAGTEDLSQLPEIAKLEKEKAEVIRSEVMAAVKKAQELNADIFGFGDAVHEKYPKQWKEMESKWDDIFPNIEVELDIEAKLRLMGKIVRPAAPVQEKK